jgi:hypothetical protein
MLSEPPSRKCVLGQPGAQIVTTADIKEEFGEKLADVRKLVRLIRWLPHFPFAQCLGADSILVQIYVDGIEAGITAESKNGADWKIILDAKQELDTK